MSKSLTIVDDLESTEKEWTLVTKKTTKKSSQSNLSRSKILDMGLLVKIPTEKIFVEYKKKIFTCNLITPVKTHLQGNRICWTPGCQEKISQSSRNKSEVCSSCKLKIRTTLCFAIQSVLTHDIKMSKIIIKPSYYRPKYWCSLWYIASGKLFELSNRGHDSQNVKISHNECNLGYSIPHSLLQNPPVICIGHIYGKDGLVPMCFNNVIPTWNVYDSLFGVYNLFDMLTELGTYGWLKDGWDKRLLNIKGIATKYKDSIVNPNGSILNKIKPTNYQKLKFDKIDSGFEKDRGKFITKEERLGNIVNFTIWGFYREGFISHNTFNSWWSKNCKLSFYDKIHISYYQ